MNQIKIGNFIAECRKEKKLTQEELAEKLNTTNKSVSKWENGKCLPNSSLYKPLILIVVSHGFANNLCLKICVNPRKIPMKIQVNTILFILFFIIRMPPRIENI